MYGTLTLADNSFYAFMTNHEITSIILLIVLVIVIAMLIMMVPSIVRYMRISRM